MTLNVSIIPKYISKNKLKINIGKRVIYIAEKSNTFMGNTSMGKGCFKAKGKSNS